MCKATNYLYCTVEALGALLYNTDLNVSFILLTCGYLTVSYNIYLPLLFTVFYTVYLQLTISLNTVLCEYNSYSAIVIFEASFTLYL